MYLDQEQQGMIKRVLVMPYYYLSDPCGEHSSLSPSIWTGILIITCQIRVLPAFIPLPLNLDRDTYYYLSDTCSPRIH